MICKIRDLVTFNPKTIGKNSNYETINYLDTANLTKNIVSEIVNLRVSEAPSRAKRIIRKGDILYSTVRPNLCHYGIVEKDYENLICSTGFAVLRANENVNPYYLYSYLTLPIITEKLHLIAENSTSAYPSIKPGDIANLEIDIPNIEIQNKIASILQRLENKMDLNKQMNNNLSELALTLFKEFIEQNKDSSEKIDLKDCVEKIGTGADAIQRAPIVDYDTGIRCIRVGDMTNNRKYYEWGFTEMTDKDFENYKLELGDIVVTRTAVNGITKIIDDNEKIVCNNGLIRLKVNDRYNPIYIYMCTKTKDFYDYIHRIDSETSVRPNMKVDYFTSYQIDKISLEKQNEFCNKIDPMLKLQKELEQEIHNLEQLRDTLLPKLMNGEIDLDNIEI